MPNSIKENDHKLLFSSLGDIEKFIVYFPAVNIDCCRQHDLISHVIELTERVSTLSPTYNEVKLSIQDLVDEGHIIKAEKAIYCANDIRQTALLETLDKDYFEDVVQLLQEQESLENPEERSYLNYKQGLRDLQIAIFSNAPIENISGILLDLYRQFPEESREKSPLFFLLDSPFSPKLLLHITPFNRILLLGTMISQAEKDLTPADHILNYWHDLYLKDEFEIPVTDLLSALLIRGRFREMENITGKKGDEKILPEAQRESYRGCLSFIRGRNTEALAYFEKSLALLNKDCEKIENFPDGYPGLLFLLALLKNGGRKRLKQGLGYLGIIEEKKSINSIGCLWNLRDVFREQLGLSTEEGRPLFGRIGKFSNRMLLGDHESLPENFFFILSLWWINRQEALNGKAILEMIREKAEKGNYLWLAAESSNLLACFDKKNWKNQRHARSINEKLGSEPIVNIVKEVPQWEKALKALSTLESVIKKEKGRKTRPKRLVWWFRYYAHDKSCLLQPRLQKLIKSGRWSKGKPLTLKQLYTEADSLEGLSQQDLKICGTISEKVRPELSWNHSGRTTYEFNLEETLTALIGHPLIFLEDTPEVRIDLVAAEPEVRVKKNESGIIWEIEPALANNSRSEVQIIKDTSTRFKVIRFNEEQRYIQKIIGKGITFPEDTEPQLHEALASISNTVTIQSDLGYIGGEIREVETDSRPHIQLIPYREGLKLEILVKPIAGANAWFRPGKNGLNIMAEINGVRVQTRRELEKERLLAQRLLDGCPTLDLKSEESVSTGEIIVEDPEECLEILHELNECKEDVVLEWPEGEKFSLKKNVVSSDLSLNIRKDRNWFKATGSLEIDENLSLEISELIDRLDNSKGRFVPLDDGSFLALTKEFHKRLEELRAYSGKSGKGVKFHPLTAPALDGLTSEAGSLTCDNYWKEHLKRLRDIIEPDLPENFKADLRDYQETGFKWLAQLSYWGVGGCLADDMGLGKTVQALAAVLLRAPKGPTLVVAPLSVINNWKDEAGRFAPDLNVKIFGRGDRQQLLDGLKPYDLLLVSYGLLQVEIGRLEKVNWQTVILDEAQVIKNRLTKRSRAAMALQSEFKVITTGTPMENHPGEMWTLFNFINPGLLGSYKQFHERFTLPIERDKDKKAGERLRKLIQPYILRRVKNEVLQELPPRTDVTLEVEMSKQEAALYAAQRRKALRNLEESEGENRNFRILTEITRLRRLCCNPSLVWPETNVAGSKLKVFGDILDELLDNDHKVLVFSQFVDHLEIIRNYLQSLNIEYQYLDGSTSARQREKSIKNFQAGEGDVFLISLRAGGFGLNLSAADYVIHMDPWWNPAVEDQASDRAHRLGQQRPVTVYRLVMKNSIEEQIVELHAKKRELADSLLEGSDLTGRISTEQLLELLKG